MVRDHLMEGAEALGVPQIISVIKGKIKEFLHICSIIVIQ